MPSYSTSSNIQDTVPSGLVTQRWTRYLMLESATKKILRWVVPSPLMVALSTVPVKVSLRV